MNRECECGGHIIYIGGTFECTMCDRINHDFKRPEGGTCFNKDLNIHHDDYYCPTCNDIEF